MERRFSSAETGNSNLPPPPPVRLLLIYLILMTNLRDNSPVTMIQCRGRDRLSDE